MKNIISLIFIGSFFTIKCMQDEQIAKMTAYDSPNKQRRFKQEIDEKLKNGLSPAAKHLLLNKSQILPYTEDFINSASIKKQ